MRTTTRIVAGAATAARVAMNLLGRWFRVEPLPNDQYEFEFKSGEGIDQQLDRLLAGPYENVITIDPQERNTILAALRYYQKQGMGDPDNREDWIHEIATDGENQISMDDAGIDALCEKVNPAETDTTPEDDDEDEEDEEENS